MKSKKYGQSETDVWADDLLKARQIVSEIMNYGANQAQINHIIGLLALELENRDHLKLYRDVFEKTQEVKVEGNKAASKIILDS